MKEFLTPVLESLAVDKDPEYDLVQYLDLILAPSAPIMEANGNFITWRAARSVYTTKKTPWFWNFISTKNGKFTAWDESCTKELNTYTTYHDSVISILHYAETLC